MVLYSQDGVAQRSQEAISLFVIALSRCVHAAVEFDDKPCFHTQKINDVFPNRCLPSELPSDESSIAQLLPEQHLCPCLPFAKRLCSGECEGISVLHRERVALALPSVPSRHNGRGKERARRRKRQTKKTFCAYREQARFSRCFLQENCSFTPNRQADQLPLPAK